MKNFLSAVLITVSALFVASCCQSMVTELGDNLAAFSKCVDGKTELFGVKNTLNDIVIVRPIYKGINYSHELIIASRGEFYDIFNKYGEWAYPKLKINYVNYCGEYLEFETEKGKYLCFSDHELFGPFASYDYYSDFDLLFYSLGDERYGAYRTILDEPLIEPSYSVIVYAIDDTGHKCFYFGDEKSVQKTANNCEIKLTTEQLALLKKEAAAHNTSWPTKGCAIVRVKKLL